MKWFSTLLVLATVVTLSVATICWSSNRQSRKANDDGIETTCRDAAGANLRYCVKFNTVSRPGKVFRECDHVYEQLFGYDVFKIRREGCWNFETQLNGVHEKGIYCACLGDRCNDGIVNSTMVDTNLP